jgi:hypothetical protein
MVFVPNPAGRPVGSRNKRTEEIWNRLEARGDKDPADLLSSIVTNEQDPKELRDQPANMLMPYKYSKRGTLPPARFVDDPIEVPDFNSVEEAEDFLASISKRAGAGELELQAALDISTLVRNWIISKNNSTEIQIKLQTAGGGGDKIIEIRGSLPALPGTNITMPVLSNGHEIDGVVLVTDQTSQPSPPETPHADGSS